MAGRSDLALRLFEVSREKAEAIVAERIEAAQGGKARIPATLRPNVTGRGILRDPLTSFRVKARSRLFGALPQQARDRLLAECGRDREQILALHVTSAQTLVPLWAPPPTTTPPRTPDLYRFELRSPEGPTLGDLHVGLDTELKFLDTSAASMPSTERHAVLRKLIGLDPPDSGSFQQKLSLRPDEWRHGLAVMEAVFLNQFDRLILAEYYLTHLNDPKWSIKRGHRDCDPVFPPNAVQEMSRQNQRSKTNERRRDSEIIGAMDEHAASQSSRAWRDHEQGVPGITDVVRLLEQDLVQPSNVRRRTHARHVGQTAFFDEALAMIVQDLKLKCIEKGRTTKLKRLSDGCYLHRVERGVFKKLHEAADGLAVLYLPSGWYPTRQKQKELSGSASRLRDRFKPEKLARRGHSCAWIAALVKQASKYTAQSTS